MPSEDKHIATALRFTRKKRAETGCDPVSARRMLPYGLRHPGRPVDDRGDRRLHGEDGFVHRELERDGAGVVLDADRGRIASLTPVIGQVLYCVITRPSSWSTMLKSRRCVPLMKRTFLYSTTNVRLGVVPFTSANRRGGIDDDVVPERVDGPVRTVGDPGAWRTNILS